MGLSREQMIQDWGLPFVVADQMPNTRLWREADGSIVVETYNTELNPQQIVFTPDECLMEAIIESAVAA